MSLQKEATPLMQFACSELLRGVEFLISAVQIAIVSLQSVTDLGVVQGNS
jgi:hypothetical protein